ncbi:MAG: pilus assembly protein TadG-related protein [Acidimicrobiales bacterium]
MTPHIRVFEVAPTGEEVGSITAFVLLLLVALVALLGLVVDGGAAMAAHQAAVDEASQAARAGAGAVSVDALRHGSLALNAPAAVREAQAFTKAAGHPGSAIVSGNVVTVTVEYRMPTTVLGIVGVSWLPISATASAVDLEGVTSGSP